MEIARLGGSEIPPMKLEHTSLVKNEVTAVGKGVKERRSSQEKRTKVLFKKVVGILFVICIPQSLSSSEHGGVSPWGQSWSVRIV